MRRTMTLAVTAAVTAGLMAAPSPARADAPAWPINCLLEGPTAPGSQTVYFDAEGRLVVNPDGPSGDVDAIAQWLPEKVLAMYPCLVTPIFSEPVVCTYEKALEVLNSMDPANFNLRYVYPNPNGPGYVVDYPRLLQDAGDLVQCQLSG